MMSMLFTVGTFPLAFGPPLEAGPPQAAKSADAALRLNPAAVARRKNSRRAITRLVVYSSTRLSSSRRWFALKIDIRILLVYASLRPKNQKKGKHKMGSFTEKTLQSSHRPGTFFYGLNRFSHNYYSTHKPLPESREIPVNHPVAELRCIGVAVRWPASLSASFIHLLFTHRPFLISPAR